MKIEVNTHEKNMIRFAAEHPEVLVLSADLGSSCEVKKFRAVYPDRYLTMGIAEQNMCSWAAGLAREGYRPSCTPSLCFCTAGFLTSWR